MLRQRGTERPYSSALDNELQTVVADLLSGQYRHPLRMVAFDTADGWMRDITAEIARKVLSCAVELDHELPPAVRDFVERACRECPNGLVGGA